MKKRSISWIVYTLALTLVMYNCKKKEEPFPTTPDTEVQKELEAITVAPVTITAPAPVTSTPATLTASAQATATANDMAQLKNGTVPASVQTASNEVKAVVSAAEINTLSSVNASTVAAVAAGGALPANLKTIMDKVTASPAMRAYLPTFTLPTVNGTPIPARSGVVEGTEGVEGLEGIEVEDACVQAANTAFDGVKTKLDATKASETTKVTTAYSAVIAPLAADEAACKAGIPTKYAAFRTAGQAQATQALADLDAAQSSIPADLYPVLKAFINIQLLGFLSSVNTLEAAEVKACTAITTAKTAAAAAARDADLAKVNENYNTALAAAQAKRTELVQTCHNQGGGR
jgi:hypothetical protein